MLKKDFPSGRYHAVCVTEISRLGRGDMEDAGRIYKAIIRYNIWIITPHKEYNPQSSADLRQIRFELFLSREEYEMIKDRLWQARDQKAKKGYAANYIVTLGYGQNRGKVYLIPDEAQVVREIFEMRAEGMSYYEIADVLNARGLKTKRGTEYYSSTINRILHNPRYIGKSRWRGQFYESKAPVIIPLELWNQVHNEIQPVRTKQRLVPKENNPYLVKLFCHHCSNRMYGEWVTIGRMLKMGARKNYNEYGIYVCVGRKREVKCTHRQRTDYVHEKAFGELISILHMPEILHQLAQERSKKITASTTSLKAKIEHREAEVKSKEEFLAKCKVDYKRGDLAAPLYSDFYEETTREIGVLRAEIRELRNRLQKAAVKIEDPKVILARLNEAVENWDQISNKSKKDVFAAFLPRIEIDRAGVLYVEKNLPTALEGIFM